MKKKVKKMFIDPSPARKAFWATDIETGETLAYPKGHSKEGQPLFKRRFIPAMLSDNPYLADSGDYETMLLSLPEHQRKQLLEGNWDIAEGAAFPEFNRTVHVVDSFEIPKNWVKFRACDYGYGTNRLEARLQCEIALREYLLRKLKDNIKMYPEDYIIKENI